MIHLDIKSPCRLNIAGEPENAVEDAPQPGYVAATPERIPMLKPKLRVRTGDRVNIGTPLLAHKKNADIVLASPGGGAVVDIKYGPRRVIREIIIRLDDEESHELHHLTGGSRPERYSRAEIIDMLLKGGMWPLVRDIVYRVMADPADTPAVLWVPLGNSDPFHPPPHVYLNVPHGGRYFETGLRALKKLCDRVFVNQGADAAPVGESVDKWITHRVPGHYPTEDPGVVHYHTKASAAENKGWFVRGEDVLMIGEFLATGKYPVARTVAVSSGNTGNRCLRTRIGAPLRTLVRGMIEPMNDRWIAGGLFRGDSVSFTSFLGLYDTALTLIPESRKRELLGFMRPGFRKPTCSRTFLSVLNPNPLAVDADMHGARRACVNCGNCARACPVDILPQFTYKSILAEEIEEALSHGLLDCVECGLCTYVCPSKVELSQTLREAKRSYYRERI